MTNHQDTAGMCRALLAVTRALAGGDPRYLEMLQARFLPHVPVQDPAWLPIRHTFDAEAAAFESEALFATSRPVEDTVRDIALGELDQALFVHLRSGSISVFAVRPDVVGAPEISDNQVNEESWRTLVPDLPAPAVDQSVALAAGDATRGVTQKVIDVHIHALLRRLGVTDFPPRARLVLLTDLFDWRVYDFVAAALASFVGSPSMVEATAPAGLTSSREILDEAISNAPLRYEYALLTANVDPISQAVRLESFPLFYRETSRSYGSVKDVQIVAPPSTRDALNIAVVARQGARLEDSILVAGVSAALPAGDSCRLWIELEGPGRVAFPNPPVQLSPLRAGLSDILAGVPLKLNGQRAASLDLVCILDLIGPEESVRARMTMVVDLITLIEQHYHVEGSLRVGLLAYSDMIHVHAELEQSRIDKPLHKIELGRPEMVVRAFERLQPFDHPARDFPGALDLAVAELSKFRWRANSQHSVFTVAAHPPHPHMQGHHRLVPSTSALNWKELWLAVNDSLQLRSVLAVDQPAWPRPLSSAVSDYLNDCWATLGRTYRTDLGGAGVDVFAEELDPSLIEGGGSLQLPLLARGSRATAQGS